MKKQYRNIYFNDERKWKSTSDIDDVLQVGKQKAIGCIVDNARYQTIKFDIQKLAEQFKAENKLTNIVVESYMNTLWVGDIGMMNTILINNKELIERNGWSSIPEVFFNRISTESISHTDNPNMYHIVCELFNSWCLHCETSISKKFVDGSTRAMSTNPYDPDK